MERVELSQPVSVGATELRDLLPLLGDGEARLIAQANTLVIETATRKVSLRYVGVPELKNGFPVGYEEAALPPLAARVPYQEFLKEVQVAAGITAVTYTIPILTGIRLIFAGGFAGIQACNGSSLTFESTIKTLASNSDERQQLVAPSSDMLIALRIARGENLDIGTSGKHFLIRSEEAVAKTPLLSGTWPPLEAVKKMVYGEPLTLPGSSLKALATAARTYKASNDVTLRPDSSDENGGIILETQDSEMGQFQERLPGKISRPVMFDVSDLDAASKISDGTVNLSLAENMGLVEAEGRKLYVLMRGR